MDNRQQIPVELAEVYANFYDNSRENIAPLPERIRLMQADGFTTYAVGWSKSDLLVDLIDDVDGRLRSKNHPLGSFSTHAPWYFNVIDLRILEKLRQNRPAPRAP